MDTFLAFLLPLELDIQSLCLLMRPMIISEKTCMASKVNGQKKQGSLLTVAKREIITIGKEETHGKYPGDLPIEQAEEKSETARDLQDFLGEEAEERGLEWHELQ